MSQTIRHHRFASGLLMLVLSFVNLLGAFLAISSLGGLGAWSLKQFVGAFGFIEIAMGIALLFGPNVWRLPVSQLRTGDAVPVRLAPDVLFIPQPAALPKILAGAGMLTFAARAGGVDWATLGVLYAAVMLAFAALALSLLVARGGVARPELDVVSLLVRRPRLPDREIGPFTLGGVAVQLLTQIGIFPLVKLAPPTILFAPVLAPSVGLVLTLTALAGLLGALALLAWRGRIDLHAPLPQRREVDEDLSG